MKIDAELFNLKAHFFFLMAGSAPIIPLLPVYAVSNLGLSYSALGFVYTVLPFIGLFTKALSGYLSDFFRCHRTTFLASIGITGLAFFSLYFMAPIPPDPTDNLANITFDCSQVSYLRYNTPSQACGQNDQLNLTDLSTCEVVCDTSPETAEYVCRSWNMTPADCPEVQLQFLASVNLNHSDLEKNAAFFPVTNLAIFNLEVENPHCSELTHLNCTAKCDNAELMDFLGAPVSVPAYAYSGFMVHYQFWLFMVFLSVAYSGYGISIVMTDTICFQILGSAPHKYGKQRMWGSIGWGLFTILTGLLIDATSGSSTHKNYAAMFILSCFVMTVDFVMASRLKVNAGEKTRINWKLVLIVLAKCRSILFLLCCIVIGLSTGVLWTYQLILVETVAYKWDCNFTHMKLLQGLIIGVQCLGGELPFFFISGTIIKKLGHVHSMSLAILAFGIRYSMYFIVTNPWLFLPLELLSGFTYGIFYTVMTSYAHIIAPPGAQATLQGVFGASFEGLGVAIGAFVGAALFNAVSEAHAFLYIGIFNVVFAVCHFAVQIVVNKCSDQGYSVESTIAEGYLSPTEALSQNDNQSE